MSCWRTASPICPDLGFRHAQFMLATAEGKLAEIIRKRIVPIVFPALARFEFFRGFLFRTVSQVTINYRDCALSEGRAGDVHGGDRLPWVMVERLDTQSGHGLDSMACLSMSFDGSRNTTRPVLHGMRSISSDRTATLRLPTSPGWRIPCNAILRNAECKSSRLTVRDRIWLDEAESRIEVGARATCCTRLGLSRSRSKSSRWSGDQLGPQLSSKMRPAMTV